jgi:hypothetical protein
MKMKKRMHQEKLALIATAILDVTGPEHVGKEPWALLETWCTLNSKDFRVIGNYISRQE